MGFSLNNKEGKPSATKWGVLLVGASLVLNTLTSAVTGGAGVWDTVLKLILELGGTSAGLGVRDLPVLNMK